MEQSSSTRWANCSSGVTLEVLDPAGKLVRRFSSSDKPELTRSSWLSNLFLRTGCVKQRPWPRLKGHTLGVGLHYPFSNLSAA